MKILFIMCSIMLKKFPFIVRVSKNSIGKVLDLFTAIKIESEFLKGGEEAFA